MPSLELKVRNVLLAAILVAPSHVVACLADVDVKDGKGSQSTVQPIKGGVHDDTSVNSSTRLFTQPAASNQLRPPVQQYSGAPNRVKKPAPAVVKPKPEAPPTTEEKPKPEVKLWGRAEDKDEEEEAKPAPRLWGEPPESTGGDAPKKAPAAKPNNGATPANGLMSWQPGYGVTQVKMLPAIKPGLRSVAGRLRQSRPNEAVAAQLSLPRHVPANWNEWYERMANAIYQVWQQQAVCPGGATIRMTVDDSENVDCEVSDFQPASDIARNADGESSFRQAALRSAENLDKSSVCQFPAVHPKKITFDVQLSRLVDGPAGCRVVHTSEAPAH